MSFDSVEAAPVQIRLFGGPVVEVGGERVRLSKYQAYLIALVFGHGKDGLSRSKAIELLWDEPEGPEQRHRLSQLLYSVKRKLGGREIVRDDPGLGIRASTVIHCDLDKVRYPAGPLNLKEVSDLSGKEFLSCIVDEPTARFGHWLAGIKKSLEAQLTQAAQATWKRSSLRGDWQDATEAAKVLLNLNPSDEELLRRVLKGLLMLDRFEEARGRYDAFCALGYQRSADWQPEEITTRLLNEVRSGTPSKVPSGAHPIRGRLIGRQEEVALFSRWIVDAPSSRCQTAVIEGEAGVGKSRLLEEVLRSTDLDGCLVLSAALAQLENQIPLNCWIDALSVPAVDEVLPSLDQPWRGVVRHLTSTTSRGNKTPTQEHISPGGVARRTFEALRILLEALSAQRPLSIFFDDFHWADNTSIAALDFISRRWQGGSCSVVITARSGDIHRRASLATFIAGVHGRGGMVHTLSDLSPAAAMALAVEVSGGKLSDPDLERISAISGQNPFFVVEMVNEVVAGRLEINCGGLLPELPSSIRQLLDARVSCLDEMAVSVLQLLCVVDRPTHIEQLGALISSSTVSPAELAGLLEPLVELRLVSMDAGVVQMRDALVRQALYESLSGPRRAALHLQIAQFYSDASEERSINQAAVHYQKAGATEQAFTTSLEASHRAEAAGAFTESIRFLEIARENARTPRRSAQIISRLAHLQYLHQDLSAAASLLAVAAGRARDMGDLVQELSAQVERLDALARLRSLSLREVASGLQTLRAEAKSVGLWEIAATALDVEVRARVREEDVEGIRQCLSEAEALLEKGTPRARCLWLNILANHQNYGDPAKARTYLMEAKDLAKKHGLEREHLLSVHRLIAVLLQQGQICDPEGSDLLALGLRTASRIGDLDLRFRILANLGAWHVDIGELEAARRILNDAGRHLDGIEEHDPRLILNVNLGELEIWTGNLDQAVERFRAAEALLDCEGQSRAYWMVRPGLGLAALLVGDLKEARRQERLVEKEPTAISFDPTLLTLFRARLLQSQGRLEQAATLITDSAERILDRMRPVALKLLIESTRLRLRFDRSGAELIAMRAYEIADELSLPGRRAEITTVLGR